MPQPRPNLDGAVWVTSTRTGPNGNCVEVARKGIPGGFVGVRDTKNRTGPVLLFTPAEWLAFIEGAKDGEFDL